MCPGDAGIKTDIYWNSRWWKCGGEKHGREVPVEGKKDVIDVVRRVMATRFASAEYDCVSDVGGEDTVAKCAQK